MDGYRERAAYLLRVYPEDFVELGATIRSVRARLDLASLDGCAGSDSAAVVGNAEVASARAVTTGGAEAAGGDALAPDAAAVEYLGSLQFERDWSGTSEAGSPQQQQLQQQSPPRFMSSSALQEAMLAYAESVAMAVPEVVELGSVEAEVGGAHGEGSALERFQRLAAHGWDIAAAAGAVHDSSLRRRAADFEQSAAASAWVGQAIADAEDLISQGCYPNAHCILRKGQHLAPGWNEGDDSEGLVAGPLWLGNERFAGHVSLLECGEDFEDEARDGVGATARSMLVANAAVELRHIGCLHIVSCVDRPHVLLTGAATGASSSTTALEPTGETQSDEAAKVVPVESETTAGVATVADLSSEFSYCDVVLGDSPSDGTAAQLRDHLCTACAYITKCRASGQGVYVHCNNGMSRSAAVVIAYVFRVQLLFAGVRLSVSSLELATESRVYQYANTAAVLTLCFCCTLLFLLGGRYLCAAYKLSYEASYLHVKRIRAGMFPCIARSVQYGEVSSQGSVQCGACSGVSEFWL